MTADELGSRVNHDICSVLDRADEVWGAEGVTNIGYKPTIGETFRGVETYLFDFDGDLYGENIDVELWKFKRPEMKFDSVEHLKNQMQADIAFGKEYFFEE